MISRTIILLIVLLLTLFPLQAHAETIELITGEIVRGKIVEVTNNHIVVDSGLGTRSKYFLEDISSIDGEKFATSPATGYLSLNNNSESADEDDVVGEVQDRISKQGSAIINDIIEIFKNNPIEALYVLSIMLLGWPFTCWPLMTIAEKFDEDDAPYAWLPIFNISLLAQLADKSRFWVVPCLVPIFSVFIVTFLWMSVAGLMKKPRILGALVLVPGMIFLVPLYLAYNRSAQFFGKDIDRRHSNAEDRSWGKDRRKRR